jgi:hypothetical protein
MQLKQPDRTRGRLPRHRRCRCDVCRRPIPARKPTRPVRCGDRAVSDVYRALTDPARRAILDELSERDGQTLFELPDGVGDDGVDRGAALLIIGASIARQFEFLQRVWGNDGDLVGSAPRRTR